MQLSNKSEGNSGLGKLDQSYNKVNVSQLYASEEKIENYRSEIKNLKGSLDSVQRDKQKIYEEYEFMREQMEDQLKQNRELLSDKLYL